MKPDYNKQIFMTLYHKLHPSHQSKMLAVNVSANQGCTTLYIMHVMLISKKIK